jgi:ribosomal protein L7Ae-like RNA K-turn-binding protein
LNEGVYHLIGFAQRAGCVASGNQAVKASLTRRRAHLLVLSSDVAENTARTLKALCEANGIPWVVVGDKCRLGQSIGKGQRVALTVNDRGFAVAISRLLAGAGDRGDA